MNRRNSDRVGWNSMWDKAEELNAQTLAELGVETGGVINCAVRLHSLSRAHLARPHEAMCALSLAGAPAAR